MPEQTNDGNGRVTMAVLRNDIQHLRTDVQQWRDELREDLGDHEDRIRGLEKSDTLTKVGAGLAASVAALVGIFVQRP